VEFPSDDIRVVPRAVLGGCAGVPEGNTGAISTTWLQTIQPTPEPLGAEGLPEFPNSTFLNTETEP